MTSVLDLDATVTLGGVSQSGHIMSVKRTGNLIRVGQTFTVDLDAQASGLAVGQSAVIAEQGTTVLTGRVHTVSFMSDPQPHYQVTGRDEFWRATDYFIDDKDLQATGQTIAYWVDALCNQCGLSYTITSTGGSETVGSTDVPVPLGLVHVVDDLRQLAGGAGWSMRMTAAGVLEFISLPDSGVADEILTVFNQGNHSVADEQVRNVAKVWGYEADNADGLIYQQRVAISGIVPDRIMVVSSPNITTLARAQTLAQMLLDHFASLDEVSTAVLPVGSPTRLVGQIKEMTIEPGQTERSILTDLESVVDREGYNQSISIGRKNFWLPTFPPGDLPPFGDLVWQVGLFTGTPYVCKINDGYLYVAGCDSSTGAGRQRLEKRSLLDGSLVWAATGVSVPPLNFVTDITFDGTYVYCTEYQDTSRFTTRITIAGGVLTLPVANSSGANGIATNGSFLYTVGAPSSTPSFSRLHRINKATMSVDTNVVGSSDTDILYDAANGNLVAAGASRWSTILANITPNTTTGQVRIHLDGLTLLDAGVTASLKGKLRELDPTTLAALWTYTSLSVIGSSVPLGIGSNKLGLAHALSYYYISGAFRRIEKINRSTHTLVDSFSDGTVEDDFTYGLDCDGTYLYTASQLGGQWVVEKRYA